jgi:hypothetical protein
MLRAFSEIAPEWSPTMPATEKLDTHHKALTLNLNASAFGSFAEIGAGQEVSHWFFVVGGASATVAKTVSAYDKEVSDDLYGAGSRYVSRQRLEAMLEKEWVQLLAQLSVTRGAHTRFFSFVDTVSARNFAGTNDAHGWVGLRFQLQPGGPANDVLLHIDMRDPSNVLQQEAVGILGVNLIYAAFYELQSEESFLASLAQDVVRERIEIDYVDFRGPAFEGWDRATVLAGLVSGGFAEAVFFSSKGPAVPPTEALYKKALVLAPGYFGHGDGAHSQVHMRLLASASQELQKELGDKKLTPAGFFCLTAAPLKPDEPVPEFPDLLRRINALLAAGGDVLLFRRSELYEMKTLVSRYTQAPVRFAVGISLMIQAIEGFYGNLAGGLLEALAHLLAQNVRIYVYPMSSAELREKLEGLSVNGWEWSETDGLVSAAQLRHAPPVGHLFAYLLASNFLVPMQVPATLKADA